MSAGAQDGRDQPASGRSSQSREVERRGAPVEFLERESYRQRRFRDVARVLPIFAAILMLLPLMWPRAAPDQSLTSAGMAYLFGLWVVLVVVSFVVSRLLTFEADTPARKTEDAGEGGR